MKKNVLFSFLAGSMLLCASTISAQDPYPYTDYRTLTIYSTGEYITADGEETEAVWSAPGVTEQAIDRVLHDWNVEPVVNTWGYAATFKAVYDAAFLYLFVKVTDDSYIPYNATLQQGDTKIDNVELFFFPDPADRNLVDGNIPDRRQTGLSQIRAWVGNENNLFTGAGYAAGFRVDAEGIANGKVIPGFEYKTKQTAAGYNLEVVIPWDIVISDAFVSHLEEGGSILFDINPANVNAYNPGDRDIILGWSTDDFHSWKANFKMGVLTFGGEYSSIISPNNKSVRYAMNNNELQLFGVENNTEVSVYDLSGRQAKTTLYAGENINLNSLSKGVYVVSVKGIGNFKIIK
ncbi:hypothetical protein FACS189463_2840 [Bacteroidia bacterium]|nr:hypothetical protein FACS189463_2840 [Bacteroidia bacterium]